MRIVVDTSALVAVLFGEKNGDRYAQALARSTPAISAGTLIELLRVVTLRRTEAMRAEVQALLGTFEIEVVPVDAAQVDHATEGHLRFGKGRSAPPAVLNFGDLFAYALARQLDAPLLFKGEDFAATDVRPAA
ncbi:MAG: type II toxin-antitoxin system VapC family toxin [Geminicoccaceae bacterium]